MSDGYLSKCDSCNSITTAVTVVLKAQMRDFEEETYEGCEHCGADCDNYFTQVPACAMCESAEVPEFGNLCSDCNGTWHDHIREAEAEFDARVPLLTDVIDEPDEGDAR